MKSASTLMPLAPKIQTDMGELPGAISKTTNFWQTFNACLGFSACLRRPNKT